MNMKLLKGYVLLGLTVLVLVAAGFLLLNNLKAKPPWTMQVFFRPVTLSPAAWLLLAGAGGIVVYWMLRHVLPRSVRSLKDGSARRRARQTEQRLRGLEQTDKSPSKSSELP